MTYPLSQTQMGIYVTCMNTQEEGNYNIDMLYKLDEEVDTDRLAKALDKVIEAHPYVKSRLVTDENGEIVFEDHSDDEFHTSIFETADIEDVRAHLGADFDLMQDQLFRIELYKTQKGNYLYVDFHHIIFDGMSMVNFLKEVNRAYMGEPLVGEETDGFAVAEHEVEMRQSAAYQQAKDWYMNEYAEAAEVDSMPLPDVQTKEPEHYADIRIPMTIDKAQVEAYCQHNDCKESMLLTMAFGYTLAKYTCDDKVLFNTIYHGRTDRSTRNSFCMMVQTLPVYIDFSKSNDVSSQVGNVAAQIVKARQNAGYSYGEACAEIGLKSEVVFAYQGSLNGFELTLDNKKQASAYLYKHHPGMQLSIRLVVEDGCYVAKVDYPTHKYSEQMVSGLMKTFCQLVKEMCEKGNLNDIECCDEEEIAKLDNFNAKAYDDDTLRYDNDETVLSMFQKAAKQYPDNVAAVFKDKKYTYRELDELTDKIGALIYNKVMVRRAHQPENWEPVVSIIIHRNEWMVLASLATLKAGCAYQPLDPSYPQERLNFMVKDADAALLIADEDLRLIINEYEGEVVLTSELLNDNDDSLIATIKSSSSLSSSSLFTLLYTSGSTGVPKGVMLEHGNLIAFSKGYCSYLSINSESRIAAYASFGFDANMMDIYCTLMNGATLHIIDDEIRLDLEALHQYFEREGITHCFMTTQVGVQYLENYPQSSSLQHLCLGGEKLRAVKPELLSYKIHNGYGPSETTCGCTFFPVKHWEPNIPIGTPTLTCKLYIVDKYGHRLPVGAPGELWINGPQVGRGYLNRPDKSAESFTQNPFDEGRVYHSGDIVRYREDGNIEFVGRKDGQVKIRGFRIELKEVEAVIRDFSGIKDVTVQAFDDPNGGKFIAAYIVSDEQVDVNALNQFILDQKPPYMVPAITMQIEKIPLNVNQKVDKKALPKPEVQSAASEQDTTPLNELQTEIKAVIASVVNTESFGLNDVLGFVGLTSISSIKLGTLLYNKFGVRVDTKNLAKRSTIKSIEEEILANGNDNDNDNLTERPTSAPLSFSQLGVYSECVGNPDAVVYNIPFCLDMPQGVTAGELKDALKKVVEAHPYLNTQFRDDEDGNTIQFQPDIVEVSIPVVKMTEQELEQEKHAFVRPFELKENPLYRTEIVESPESMHLLLDVHHLIMDGGSIDVFVNDLCKALDGKELKAERYDYYQFVQDQKIDEEVEKFFEVQVGQIEDASALLPDLYDANDDHSEGCVECKADLASVAEKCRNLNITPAAFYLAAVQIAVSKYTAEDLVGICTISNGRSNLRIAESFGMFVNTLPIVANVDSAMSIEDYLKQTANVFAETIEHEDYPFARVAEKFGYAANIMYAYQVGVLNRYLCGKGELKMQSLELQTAKFPVYVSIDGSMEQGGTVCVKYDESLFSESMMQGFAAAVEQVAESLLACEKVGDVEISNEEEIAKLDSFNAKAYNNDDDTLQPVLSLSKGYDDDETVLSLFQKAAKQYPDNVAAVFKEKQYTYKQLDELTDKIGALIYSKVMVRRAHQPEDWEPVVSILIPRNEYMFILPLSAMKAGCAYQPLDPSYPQERLNFMVKDADAALLIADNELKDIVNEYEGEVVLTSELLNDNDDSLIATIKSSSSLSSSSLFTLLYTSGSTGVPKGVMLEHGNLVAFIKWYRRYYDLKPEHNVAAYASFGFDANMMDMYPALTTGSTLHVVAEELRLDLVALNEYFEKNQITHSFITTQVGVQFLQNTENHSLKHLSVGGEKLVSVDPAEGYTFHNGYGPTECTIFSTTLPVLKKEPNIPIGKPTDELECYVMDKQLHRLPVGAAGELVIVGKQVGRGYLNRPDKTAEAFFTYNGKRAYHSGDIVRYREDGNIEFVGRKDGQVKIRGFRIELKEVEAVIRDFPGISNVTVQAFDDPNGGKFIAAYIVSSSTGSEQAQVDIEALNQFILDQKPPYMVPAVTMQIPEIPLNVNQKVDKKALPKPEVKAKAASDAPAAPLNFLETELKAIIASVVNTEDFGITDVLGYVGLTSISSIKLATLIYKRFGIQVNSKTLAKTGSLQSIENEILAKWMKGEVKSSEETQELKNSQTQELTSAPLTYPQMGVYLDCLKNPGSTMYNVPFHIVMPEGITVEELQEAVKATIDNHQSFRLTFGAVDGENCQIFNADMPVEMPVSEMSEATLVKTAQSFVRPFNMAEGPLFRFEIVKTESRLHLFVDMHHLITDGGSFDIIVKEISARLNGDEVENEDYTYLQFAADQKAAEDGEEYQSAKAFFDSRLASCEGASEITGDMPKNDEASHTIGVSSRPVIYAPVEALAKRLGVTPMSVFLAAAYYTVSRFVNNKQVYLGTISNGRSNLRTYNTTGMFVNTLALSSEIKEQTVADYINETAENFIETINHEQYPFAQIAADYGFKPEIVFEYQVGVINNNYIRGEQIAINGLTLDLAKFKAKIVIGDDACGGYEIRVGYDEAVYSPALAQTLAASVSAVVEHFVSQPDALVKTISIMSKEQEQQVETLRSVATAPVESKLFYEPIEKFALSQPDKVALIAADRTLTYSEFNAEANRVAHALMARGVQKGDRVVVLLPRTSAVMLTIFGVSKAGAAYIPCDPEYPADRINLITEDSEARFVITTKDKMENYPGKAIDIEELINENDRSALPLGSSKNENENWKDNPNVAVTPDDLVYLIYTSGSTGRPKGVMLRHEGICNYLQCHPGNRHIYAMATEGSCYLSVTTLSFDMSLKEYGVALFNGLTLVLTDETQSNNPIELARLFKETKADIFNATPSRLLNYMELPEFCDALRQCKCVLSGGEAYSDKLLARLHELGPKHIFNTYGPTEITVSSNCAELTDTDHITIGQPLLNYIEFVVDVDGNELPVGVVGELYIGGVGVAKGYNNLEKQTKERFVEYKGVRCYRSGDYARWTPDGRIVTLGRMDNQIKLRGLRIELGEVEAAICKVEGVKQTVVMVKKIDNVEHLTAYFTADRPIDIEDMKAQIGTTLTHYMVPTAYLQMEKFPLTPNGKTDVKHLPEPQLAKVGGDYVAPKNKIEEDFCHIFESILTLDKVSAADSFFDLGGTSLTATRVIIEAKNLGYDIAYSEVFSNPTAQALAKLQSNENDPSTGSGTSEDLEVTDYDYTKINELLQGNNLDSFRNGERLPLGDVLLTGANGYLGIHILHNLLENHLKENPQYKVYCLVRHGHNGVTSEDRLKNLLFYYFESNYKEMFGTQLIVIDGDVTNPKAFDEVAKMLSSSSSLTLINCAAIVKHFSEGTEIEDINIGGLQNCVDFCLKTGARLIQTSTNSTGGESVNGYPDPQTNYGEQIHYFGQYLRSKYTHSKFLAERIVLEAIIEKGLVAKVMRLGNLAPRAVDGEFQINFRSNSAMGRLHIFQMLGACSYNTTVSKMEFSPIDEVADAILRLSTTPKECCIFHPFNDHMVKLGDVVQEMARTLNVDIAEVEEEDFQSRLNEAAQDPEKAKILQSMLAYKTSGKDKVAGFAKYNPYTIHVLARLGFHWDVTSWDYVQRFISAIAALDFFEDKR